MTNDIAVHLNPVWRNRADFIIFSNLQKHGMVNRWEQLWAKQLNENTFEICCIPFFVYDLALGDHVETISEEEKDYVIYRLVHQSGHFTFRVWFGQSTNQNIKDKVINEVKHLGCLFEWYSQSLLGVDADSDVRAQTVANFLHKKQQQSKLMYETGRSK